MFAFVFEEMTCDDVIQDGITQKLQPLITIGYVVVVVRRMGKCLNVCETYQSQARNASYSSPTRLRIIIVSHVGEPRDISLEPSPTALHWGALKEGKLHEISGDRSSTKG